MEESPNRTTADLAKSYGSNWTKANVTTLFEWLAIAAYNMRSLELSILYYRGIIRRYTIFGLFISTLSGTLSVVQLNTSGSLPSTVTTILNGCFTFFSFTIAIFTGFIKVYQIQEQLEHFIKLKQDWIVFSTSIASELQLPIELRRDALFLITKNKNIYLDLLKVDAEFPSFVAGQVKREMPFPDNLGMHVSTLHEIVMEIGSQELKDLESLSARNKDRFSTPMTRKVLTPIPENVMLNDTTSLVKHVDGNPTKPIKPTNSTKTTNPTNPAKSTILSPSTVPVPTASVTTAAVTTEEATGSAKAAAVAVATTGSIASLPAIATATTAATVTTIAEPNEEINIPVAPTIVTSTNVVSPTSTSPDLTSITLTVNP